jgi:GntR family transcriptional repressor for pyruvate dehydrogenase complex
VEMFQTSRASLREALRVLEQKGLIDIKLGVSGGAVIKAVDTEPVTESLALLIQHQKVSLEELAEFREGVEGNVAALAARRATHAEIVKLKDLLETARECVRQGVTAWEKFCEVDNAIHVAIAAASGNSIYGFVLRMVHGNIQKYYEAHPLKDERILKENYDDLCEIVRALEKKQATAVKSLVRGHVRRFNRYMLNNECG